MSTITSSDYKLDKNGRRFPAKRFHMGEKKQQLDQVTEASYRGNIGVMELAKFHSSASQDDKDKFTNLMKKKSSAKSEHEEKQMASQIWDHVQKVTGTKLQQMESTMQAFRTMVESKEDFILQSLADKDINASIKDGKVVVHDHSQHAKAKSMVKRMGMPHEVVKSVKEETDTLETPDTVVQEAMPTHEFNKLVRGYLAHKKAAKAGNFKPMSMDQYKRTAVKALSVKEDTETIEELSKESLDKYSKKAEGDTKKGREWQRLSGVIRAQLKKKKNVSEEVMDEANTVVVPTLKPRDPNHKILAMKKNAGGAHRDKKKEAKRGQDKHKGRMCEDTQDD